MRVLLICPSWGRPCGIASYTERLSAGLAALGVGSDAATNPASIKRCLDDRRYEGIFLQHEYGLYYFNLVAILTLVTRTGLPFVITMHNTDHRGWMGAQHLFLLRAPDAIVVHSEAARDNLLKAPALGEPSRVKIIPMGCPDYRATFGPVDVVRREMGLVPDVFTVGFFGFASQHKGIANLVRALHLLPDIQGFINAAVHPVNPLAVETIYRDCGLTGPVGPRSRAENVILNHERIPDEVFGRYMNAVDVVLLPYVMHGLSVSVSMMAHDALASARPVIVTDVSYFSDLDHEVLRIPNNEPETIAAAVTAVRDDSALAGSLAKAGLAYAERNSWTRIARAYLDLLEGCR